MIYKVLPGISATHFSVRDGMRNTGSGVLLSFETGFFSEIQQRNVFTVCDLDLNRFRSDVVLNT